MKPGIRSTFIMALVLLVLAPSWAGAQVTFTQIVVFGTSLSDPGNVFALTGGKHRALRQAGSLPHSVCALRQRRTPLQQRHNLDRTVCRAIRSRR